MPGIARSDSGGKTKRQGTLVKATVRLASRLRGPIDVPGDQSISHRAVIFNALAEDNALVRGFLRSEDCRFSVNCLSQLAAQMDLAERPGAQLDCAEDRRLAIDGAIGGLIADGETSIERSGSVDVSYPGFWGDVDVEEVSGAQLISFSLPGYKGRG